MLYSGQTLKIWRRALLAAVMVSALLTPVFAGIPPAEAIAKLVQSNTAAANAGTVQAAFASAAKKNHLLIAICSARTATTVSAPAGFQAAVTDFASAPYQAIYYKVAAGGETAITCGGSGTARRGVQIYEYSGTATTGVLEAVNSASSRGNSVTASSGTVTTTSANTLLLAGVTFRTAGTGISTWTNSFTERSDFAGTARFAGADNYPSTSGAYLTRATNSTASAWVGQIAAFKLLPIGLTTDIVDGANSSVAGPSVNFGAKQFGFSCQTSTGTLGTALQQLRIVNTTATPAWSLSIGATSGAAALWTDGGIKTYDFNDPTGSGCDDGIDADAVGGQLSIDSSAATITSDASCSGVGVNKNAATAFNQGVVDSITLVSGSATAELNCMWNITGIALSQKIPSEPSPADYVLGLTLTVVAN